MVVNLFLMEEFEEFKIYGKLPNGEVFEIDAHSKMSGAQVSFILFFFIFYCM
jgi:hypothetical protein